MALTLKQCAEKAGQNESTARFYRDKFEEYFVFTGEGRHRRYSEENASLLILIAKLYRDGLDYEQVKESLDERYGVPVTELVPVVEGSSTNAVQQKEFMEAIRAVFREELEKRDEVILGLQDEIASVKAEVSMSIRSADNRDLKLMELIRTIQQQNNRNWWQKLWNK